MSHESLESKTFEVLQILGSRESWRISELPDEIDHDIIVRLDAQGFIEIDLMRWHREVNDVGGTKEQLFTHWGHFFSPAEHPEIAGTILEVLQNPFRNNDSASHYGAKGPCFEDCTEIRLTFLGRGELQSRNIEQAKANPALNRAATDADVAGKDDCTHGIDYRSVRWNGTLYSFTPLQSKVVELLWDAYDRSTPDVGDNTLMNAVDSKTSRMVDIFRGSKAIGTMIVPGGSKGTHRLSAPTS